jgi:four helix bundle protein
MGNFQALKVWQRSKDLAVYIYKLTTKGQFSKDYSLRDQIRRAAVSIPSNIAEGDEYESDRQSVRFFYIAKGSSAEVLTQAIISHEIGYINERVYKYIESECKAISGMTMRLIQARSKP